MHFSRDFSLKEKLPAALEVSDYLKRRRSLSYKTVTKPDRVLDTRTSVSKLVFYFFFFHLTLLLPSRLVYLPSILLEIDIDRRPHLKFIMSTMLTYVPITRPRRPNTISKRFFTSMIMQGPKSRSGQRTQISMMAGNAMPSAERQRAPNREMKRPSLGTVMANVTIRR